MKIKKFNEIFQEAIDNNYFPISDIKMLTDSDINQIHRSGRKIYYINN